MAEGINLKMKVTGANKVQRELKQTGTAAGRMGKKMQTAGGAAGALGGNLGAVGTVLKAGPSLINPFTAGIALAAAGLVAVAAAANLAKSAFVGTIKSTLKLADELDEIAKKSRSIGASAEDLQLLQGAFALNGVEADQLNKSLQKLNQGMGEAMKGTKSYTDAFDAIGVSAEELEAMPLREKMLAIAGGMEELGSKARQAQVAALIFGRAGKDMLVAFEEGEESLEEAIVDIERFGVASNESVRNAEEMNDSILRMERAFYGLKVSALEPIMPVLGGIADGVAEIVAEMDKEKAGAFGEAFAEGMVLAVKATFELIKAQQILWEVGRPVRTGLLAMHELVEGNFEEAKKLGEEVTSQMGNMDKAIVATIDKWDDMSDTMVDSIEQARAAAAGPLIFPRGRGPDRPEDRGKKGKKGKEKKKVDPLADLKAQLKAFRLEEQAALDSFKTKEQLLDEHLTARLLAIAEFRDAGLIGAQAAMAMELAFAAEHDAALLAIEEKRWEKIRAMRTSFYTLLKVQGDEMREQMAAASADFKEAQSQAAVAVLTTVGTVAGQIGSVISALSDDQNEEAKAAAKVFFGIQQATSMAIAIMKMAEAIGVANALPFPGNIPAMITAGAIGAAQIATIAGTTITGLADAGLPPGALKQAGLSRHTVLAVRNDEMVLDPVGTQAISRMLQQQAGGGQPIQVNTTLEIDGDVLGRTVDSHLIRSSERGHRYQDRIRY